MPNRATLITALILDRPMCLDCIAAKSGLPADTIDGVLQRIGRVLNLQRTVERCRACGETDVEVASVARPPI